MIAVSDIKARLEARVPALTGRVHGSAELSRLTGDNQIAQVAPAAYVLLAGLNGGDVTSASTLYVQHVDRVLSVLLVWRAAQDNQIPTVEALIEDVIAALAGWDPGGDVVGVFTVARGGVLNFQGGTLVYQLDFSLPDQLRITP